MTNRERKIEDIKVQLTALESLAPYGLTIAEKLREKELERELDKLERQRAKKPMGQYEKTRAMIYQLEKEIADLKKQAEEIAESIAIREQQKADAIAYLKELDAMDNTDPEHRGDDAYY